MDEDSLKSIANEVKRKLKKISTSNDVVEVDNLTNKEALGLRERYLKGYDVLGITKINVDSPNTLTFKYALHVRNRTQ